MAAVEEHLESSEHGGRPRDPTRDEVIRRAALDLVAEEGYDRVTVDAIADRAGAGKATLYRRWRSKADLVVDAITDLKPVGRAPDTGSLREDLDRLCDHFADQQETRALAVMQGLASAIHHDPELRAVFDERVVAPRRAAMAEIFARAAARGEMPAGKDVDLLTSVVPALLMHRLVSGKGACSPAFARQVIEEVVIPAATAPTGPSPRTADHTARSRREAR